MGAVRMRVQAADKNITIIHNTLVHQVKSCANILMDSYVRGQQGMDFLTGGNIIVD